MLETPSAADILNHAMNCYFHNHNRTISAARLSAGRPSVKLYNTFERLQAKALTDLAHPRPASYEEIAQLLCDLIWFLQHYCMGLPQTLLDDMTHQTLLLIFRHKRIYSDAHSMTRRDFDEYLAPFWMNTLHTLNGSLKAASRKEFSLTLRMFAYHDRHGPYGRYMDYLDTLYPPE
jgi:hypothetical protein